MVGISLKGETCHGAKILQTVRKLECTRLDGNISSSFTRFTQRHVNGKALAVRSLLIPVAAQSFHTVCLNYAPLVFSYVCSPKPLEGHRPQQRHLLRLFRRCRPARHRQPRRGRRLAAGADRVLHYRAAIRPHRPGRRRYHPALVCR